MLHAGRGNGGLDAFRGPQAAKETRDSRRIEASEVIGQRVLRASRTRRPTGCSVLDAEP